jgi:phosphatidylserine/phosphatidylglycerophosphate/cardiolipin synthase-like enzyme
VAPVFAADAVYFSATDNIADALVQKINAETVRIDMSAWYLTERAVTQALVNRFNAGVTVRVLGDRGSIFEIDPKTRDEFYWLASQGVPIRLRYDPTWYPEIHHWKATIFAGQNIVAFGSANYTPFELAPWSPTNYKDEVVLFTDELPLVKAFKTKFDVMWHDTTPEPESLIPSAPYFRDWDTACALEAACADYLVQYPNPKPMVIDTSRRVPDNPLPPEMVWGQGAGFNSRLVEEIAREPSQVDFVIYRLTVDSITSALLAKFQSGVPVRLIVEPDEYLNRKWPEFWITHANIDKLWAAGIPIKQRRHEGLTHMKVLLTSSVATVASSNLAAAWQRDHNYFLPASAKPAIYQAIKNRFQAMWSDPVGFGPFTPQPPDTPSLASPAAGASGVSPTTALSWSRAPFATDYDVYLGTHPSALTKVGNVPAALVNDPPATYAWTPPAPLQGNTTYYWQIVARTFATPVDPSIVASSDLSVFTTEGLNNPPPPPGGGAPYGGTPAAVPGTIEAERFNEGGAGVAYQDLSAGNAGGAFRNTDVDLEATTDAGGGYNVGWISPGEWLNFTVNVTAAGTYNLEARVASPGAGGRFHIEVDGTDKTGPLNIPDTGGWQAWTTVTATGIALTAGTQALRLVIDAVGPGGGVGNVNWIRLSSSPPGNGGTPYGGTPAAVPGTIEAERFNEGGAGVAYQDLSAGNAGGAFRSTDVDLEATTDTGGGYNVGWISPGEWLNFTVNVTAAGSYNLEARVASPGAGGRFHVEVNGTDKTGPLNIPDTGGWQAWTTVTATGIALTAGTQVLRLVIDAVGPGGGVGNVNWIRLSSSSSGNGGTPYGGTPAAVPGTIEAERFNEGGAGVAYQDLSAGNAGGAFRNTDVDLEATTDAGGGYNVGWISPGEWLNFTVNVTAAGTYTLDIRVASSGVGGHFHVDVNGVDKTGPLAMPDTGGWQVWTTVTKTGVSLAAGTQVLRLFVDTVGPTGSGGNFNWLRVR